MTDITFLIIITHIIIDKKTEIQQQIPRVFWNRSFVIVLSKLQTNKQNTHPIIFLYGFV